MENHRIMTYDPDENEQVYWECSCGRSGSCAEWKAGVHSDKHIDYDLGEGRTDVYPAR